MAMVGYAHLAVLLLVLVLASFAEAWRPARAAANGDRRLLTNFGLGVIAMLTGLLPWIGPVAAAALAKAGGWGLLHGGHGLVLPLVAQSVLAILIISLASYGLHRLMHGVDALWLLHRLHHSDANLDFSTGFRTHPLEAIVSSAVIAAVVVSTGLDPVAVAIALIVLQALDLLAHSNVHLPDQAERALGQVLATPAMHARHHSADRREHDSNFGNGIIVWDRLFGTFSGRETPQRLGLD